MENRGSGPELTTQLTQNQLSGSSGTVRITIRISDHKILIKVKLITLRLFKTTHINHHQMYQGSCKLFPQLISDIKKLRGRAQWSKHRKFQKS